MIKSEWKNICSTPKGIASILAIMVLPVLYTGLFLWAFWDPYSNLNELPVAIVNEDVPHEFEGETFHLGDELVTNLIEGETFQFEEVTKSEADKGLANGDYYLSIEIPETFSQHATTLLDDEPQKLTIDYVANEGQNFLGGQIGETAVTKIRDEVNEEVSRTYAEMLFNVITELGDGYTEAASGAAELNDGAADVAEGADSLANGAASVTAGAQKVQQGLQALQRQMAQLKPMLQAEHYAALSSAIVQLQQGSGAVVEGAKSVQYGAGSLADGTTELFDGTTKLSDELASASDEAGDISATEKTYDMMAAPVQVEKTIMNEVPNYGTGFAPYFISLGLAVGGLLIAQIYDYVKAYRRPTSATAWFMSKMSVMLIISIVQALLVTIVTLTIGVHVEEPWLLFGFSLLTSFAFVSVVQLLVTWFGDVGKFMALVVLIIQLVTSAGTFPIELIPSALQSFYGVLPMTYTVEAFRAIISTGDVEVLRHSSIMMAVFTVPCIVFTYMYFMVKFRHVRKLEQSIDDSEEAST